MQQKCDPGKTVLSPSAVNYLIWQIKLLEMEFPTAFCCAAGLLVPWLAAIAGWRLSIDFFYQPSGPPECPSP
jgi:hypothetical protein